MSYGYVITARMSHGNDEFTVKCYGIPQQWHIGGMLAENAPIDASALLPGDTFTQLSLNDCPSNLWCVDRVVDDPLVGVIVYCTNGTRLYITAIDRSEVVWFQSHAQ